MTFRVIFCYILLLGILVPVTEDKVGVGSTVLHLFIEVACLKMSLNDLFVEKNLFSRRNNL